MTFNVIFVGRGGQGPWILIYQISIFDGHLMNNSLCLKSNGFDLRLKISNLDWHQEIILIVFWKHFTWHTSSIIWEIFKNFFNYISVWTGKTILLLLSRRIINIFGKITNFRMFYSISAISIFYWYLQVFFFIFFKKCNIINIEIILCFISPLQQFFI